MHDDIVGTVMTEAQEVLDSIFESVKGLVTAVTVSMFKTKDAPLTALDILENMKTLSSVDVIERVRETVQKKLDGQDTAIEAKKSALHSIAAGETPNSVIDDKETASDEATESIF
jgi:predicted RNA polymerase sigma factor